MSLRLRVWAVFTVVLSIWLAAVAGVMSESPTSTGPMPGTRMTEEYVRQVGRMAYLWGYPMVSIHNRKKTLDLLPEPGLAGGTVPVAPPNQICVLTDYISSNQKLVACPNQDVIYGFGIFDLGKEPVVIQVPEFGDRYWVIQLCDQRTDGFGQIGRMYESKPGFYLVVGPDWKGSTPKGIDAVVTCPTRLAVCIPRAFLDDTPEDRLAIFPAISQLAAYPLSKFDGVMRSRDWRQAPRLPTAQNGNEEVRWVRPETFFESLRHVLEEVPPLPGEEAVYSQYRSVLEAAGKDPKLKAVLRQSAIDADRDLMQPLFQFRNYGVVLSSNWTTIRNGGAFGTDYFTRAAVAKSNIFVNKSTETRYFYQDLDSAGQRLNGGKRYVVTFAPGQLPPVKGFWSLTIYNEYHFFHPNEWNRFSLGTKNKSLKINADGSLTIHVQTTPPPADRQANWLPSPPGDFSLYLRACWPEPAITSGAWAPPPVTLVPNGR